ncbi:MAG TPA: hypothetical protein VFA07_01150 [Chthonomonadaceae bacterium]|nr:hypothetical protein [Chthonomonadaceae bacterium]
MLAWRVHLLRRDPSRLPALLMVLLLAMACVWMMFGALLPVLAAVLLLLGAAGEYLFPLSYQITAEGVFANTLAGRNALPWKEARRCWRERGGLIVTPLAKPSRLDAFRGVLVRFAPDGEPGDRASVLEAIRRCAPDLLPEAAPAAPLPSQES